MHGIPGRDDAERSHDQDGRERVEQYSGNHDLDSS
jgi:hypothetical protein